MNKLNSQKGFTLVEIAIVLVIIGLLLGGVLKGQELIKNAKINSVLKDFEGIATAYYGYLDRMGKAPGVVNGNFDSDASFWSNLRSEGFISGTSLDNDIEPIPFDPFAVSVPRTSDPEVTGPQHALGGNFLASGSNSFFETNFICASNIEEGVALGIDRRLDDGQPGTGSIRTGINIEVSTAPDDMIPQGLVSGSYTEGSELSSTLCKAL